MIRLTKSELLEMASVFVAANTPLSLVHGLLKCHAVDRMRYEAEPNQLLAYYDQLTARAARSEIVVGLAYGLLIGILLNRDNANRQVRPDASRLVWGEYIEQAAPSMNTPTSVVTVSGSRPTAIPTISGPSQNLIILPG